MITTLWRKHFTELRGLWAFALIFAVLPSILLTVRHSANPSRLAEGFVFMFTFIMMVIPPRFAGTGLATSAGIRPRHGTDPSLLFTLSLPVRRRSLFFFRSSFALFALESAAVIGLLAGTATFVHMGDSWQLVGRGLWVLLAITPVYFLDCLLSIWFSEASIVFSHVGCIVGLVIVLSLIHVPLLTVITALQDPAPIPFVLFALLFAAAFAAATVWKLDQQNY